MMKRCDHCKRSCPAILKPDGKAVILPHSPTGGEVKFGETCRAKRP